MSTPYFEAHAPIPPLDERHSNVFESKVASPADGRSNGTGPTVRQGHRQAEEGLAQHQDVAAGVLRGATDAYQARHTFQHQMASGKRSEFGSRIWPPSWTDEGEYLDAFSEGTTLSRSERRYEHQVAYNPRNHRNDAEVRD